LYRPLLIFFLAHFVRGLFFYLNLFSALIIEFSTLPQKLLAANPLKDILNNSAIPDFHFL